MSRLNSYPLDTNFETGESLLGTDSQGRTATFSQDSIVEAAAEAVSNDVTEGFVPVGGDGSFSDSAIQSQFTTAATYTELVGSTSNNIRISGPTTVTIGAFTVQSAEVGDFLILINDETRVEGEIRTINTDGFELTTAISAAEIQAFNANANALRTATVTSDPTVTITADTRIVGTLTAEGGIPVNFGNEAGEVAEWAEGNNTDQIPANKLDNAQTEFGLAVGDVATWAAGNSGEQIPRNKLANAQTTFGSADGQVATWAEGDNTDDIPESKIPDTIARDSEVAITNTAVNVSTAATGDPAAVTIDNGQLDVVFPAAQDGGLQAVPFGAAAGQVATWAEGNDTNPIPDSKLVGTVTLATEQIIPGNKNFTGTLQQGGSDVLSQDDLDLMNSTTRTETYEFRGALAIQNNSTPFTRFEDAPETTINFVSLYSVPEGVTTIGTETAAYSFGDALRYDTVFTHVASGNTMTHTETIGTFNQELFDVRDTGGFRFPLNSGFNGIPQPLWDFFRTNAMASNDFTIEATVVWSEDIVLTEDEIQARGVIADERMVSHGCIELNLPSLVLRRGVGDTFTIPQRTSNGAAGLRAGNTVTAVSIGGTANVVSELAAGDFIHFPDFPNQEAIEVASASTGAIPSFTFIQFARPITYTETIPSGSRVFKAASTSIVTDEPIPDAVIIQRDGAIFDVPVDFRQPVTGVVDTTTTQTIGGAKTFADPVEFDNTVTFGTSVATPTVTVSESLEFEGVGGTSHANVGSVETPTLSTLVLSARPVGNTTPLTANGGVAGAQVQIIGGNGNAGEGNVNVTGELRNNNVRVATINDITSGEITSTTTVARNIDLTFNPSPFDQTSRIAVVTSVDSGRYPVFRNAAEVSNITSFMITNEATGATFNVLTDAGGLTAFNLQDITSTAEFTNNQWNFTFATPADQTLVTFLNASTGNYRFQLSYNEVGTFANSANKLVTNDGIENLNGNITTPILISNQCVELSVESHNIPSFVTAGTAAGTISGSRNYNSNISIGNNTSTLADGNSIGIFGFNGTNEPALTALPNNTFFYFEGFPSAGLFRKLTSSSTIAPTQIGAAVYGGYRGISEFIPTGTTIRTIGTTLDNTNARLLTVEHSVPLVVQPDNIIIDHTDFRIRNLPTTNPGNTGSIYTQTGSQLGLTGAAATLKFVIQN